MGEKRKPTSLRLSDEDHEGLQWIKQHTAIMEYKRTGRWAKDLGDGYEVVMQAGIAAKKAVIAQLWTPEHEELLKSPPGEWRASTAPGRPSPPRVSPAVTDAALAEEAARGIGPGSPLDDRIASAARLFG